MAEAIESDFGTKSLPRCRPFANDVKTVQWRGPSELFVNGI